MLLQVNPAVIAPAHPSGVRSPEDARAIPRSRLGGKVRHWHPHKVRRPVSLLPDAAWRHKCESGFQQRCKTRRRPLVPVYRYNERPQNQGIRWHQDRQRNVLRFHQHIDKTLRGRAIVTQKRPERDRVE